CGGADRSGSAHAPARPAATPAAAHHPGSRGLRPEGGPVTGSRSRIVAGIAITVVLTVAVVVVLLTQGRHPASEAVTTTERLTPTTPPPVTTTKPNPPNATGENWLAIMSDILTYRHSLYENPQPDLLDQIYDKRCPCYAQERTALQDLIRKGWRYNDNGVK